jgi:hypothetical protein
MGIRIGTGLGPISVSARIGGGGGGGGGGGFSGEWFPVILIIAALSAITAGGRLIDNLVYWIVFNLLPIILLWVLAFSSVKYFPMRTPLKRSFAFLISAISPITYFIFMQKVPLVNRDMESLSGPEKQKLYGSSTADLAPWRYWAIAILVPLVCIYLIMLVRARIATQAIAREPAKQDKRNAEQAVKTAALRRNHQRTLNAKQNKTKELKVKLEESLARLADITDKALTQSPDAGSASGIYDDKNLELLNASLRESFTDVRDCLYACQGFLSSSEIKNHQNGLLKLRQELEDNFGFKDL